MNSCVALKVNRDEKRFSAVGEKKSNAVQKQLIPSKANLYNFANKIIKISKLQVLYDTFTLQYQEIQQQMFVNFYGQRQEVYPENFKWMQEEN